MNETLFQLLMFVFAVGVVSISVLSSGGHVSPEWMLAFFPAVLAATWVHVRMGK